MRVQTSISMVQHANARCVGTVFIRTSHLPTAFLEQAARTPQDEENCIPHNIPRPDLQAFFYMINYLMQVDGMSYCLNSPCLRC